MFNLSGYFTCKMVNLFGYLSIRVFNSCGYFTVKNGDVVVSTPFGYSSKRQFGSILHQLRAVPGEPHATAGDPGSTERH